MTAGTCPECDFKMSMETARKGEVLDCADCGVSLEVVKLNDSSIEFSVAATDEEDWGE